ncbi:MAG: epoxyqueuosine reductase [Syntrophobacteraceae bacterium]
MHSTPFTEAPRSLPWIGETIRKTIDNWKLETKGPGYWREPLVAVADANDPLFASLREVVDASHALPGDLLPDARSVVVFFLPFQEWLGHENAVAGEMAARSWAQAYVATNLLIKAINLDLEAAVEARGGKAAPTPATHNFDEQRLVSGWSHKHLAYIAGLGSFGSHHWLITPSGCCGRLGSLVTTLELPITPRLERELCLVKTGKKCHACVAHCGFGALQPARFDRHLCYARCLKNDAYHEDLPLVDVCGKCGCDVPCSYSIPLAVEKTSRR